MFDFLVAGAGPAGAVTAMCLARGGAKVAILEATRYDGERFGETLPPEINPVLRELDLWREFMSLSPTAAPGIVSVWGTVRQVELDFVGNPHGDGWRVDRNAFDAMLLGEAQRVGAESLIGVKAEALTRSGGAWKVGNTAAAILIDAAGRNGLAIPNCSERHIDDELVVVALRLSYEASVPNDARTYIETTPGGWWYSGLLPNKQVMAMFFTDPETYREEGVVVGDRLIGAPLTRGRMSGARIESSRVVYAPSSCRKTVAAAEWAAVGDAASAYDPLSGRGIFKALRHGSALARAYLGGHGGIEDYARMVRAEFDAYARQRRAYYASERRWPESGFWRRRLERSS